MVSMGAASCKIIKNVSAKGRWGGYLLSHGEWNIHHQLLTLRLKVVLVFTYLYRQLLEYFLGVTFSQVNSKGNSESDPKNSPSKQAFNAIHCCSLYKDDISLSANVFKGSEEIPTVRTIYIRTTDNVKIFDIGVSITMLLSGTVYVIWLKWFFSLFSWIILEA